MKSERLLRGLIVVALLGVGILVARLRPSPIAPGARDLGETLWWGRQADLVLQLGLMLVGALGIRALLPGQEEDQVNDIMD